MAVIAAQGAVHRQPVQLQAINQINHAVGLPNLATRQNAAASEELTATAEEMGAQAHELGQLTGCFRLERGG
jgi:methyl-accepting chemotaxis protein